MPTILAFSDLHRNLNATSAIVDRSDDADLLIGAGDFATRGTGLDEVITELANSTRPVVLVPGNHESLRALQQACDGHESMYILHGSSTKIAGLTLFGLGYEIPSRNDASWNQTLREEDAKSEFAKCNNADVIITHTPALGHCDRQKDDSHEGSAAILDAVQRIKPSLHLCGHIHHSWGTHSLIGNAKTVNLGPALNWFECPP